MRRKVGLVAVLLLASFLATASYAQQGGMGSQMPKAEPPASGSSPMQGGMCPMCSSGMCPMMGGMQGASMPMMGMHSGGMPMMGGMSGAPSDSPRMVQMRGEMMKAMGEIMMKYGKMMEGGGR